MVPAEIPNVEAMLQLWMLGMIRPGAAFIAAAVVGFKSSLWLVALALAVHGVFDLVHGRLIFNPGVPAWWPAFCSAYDVVAGAYLAWLLKSNRVRSAP